MDGSLNSKSKDKAKKKIVMKQQQSRSGLSDNTVTKILE